MRVVKDGRVSRMETNEGAFIFIYVYLYNRLKALTYRGNHEMGLLLCLDKYILGVSNEVFARVIYSKCCFLWSLILCYSTLLCCRYVQTDISVLYLYSIQMA